jgi:hypothetical protein
MHVAKFILSSRDNKLMLRVLPRLGHARPETDVLELKGSGKRIEARIERMTTRLMTPCPKSCTMWVMLLFTAVITQAVGVSGVSVNATFHNHSHLVVTADEGTYVYDIAAQVVDGNSVDLSVAPILRSYGQMT